MTAFYSWQSDLPKDVINLHRKAVEEAIAKFNKTAVEPVKFDEATRDETGSPDISNLIFNKISSCDIFIADVSTINHLSLETRKLPNPNVCIELGYAVSKIGWERIILIFNEAFGDFKTELPFDMAKRRLSHFNIKDGKDTNGAGQLRTILIDGIKYIVQKNPPYGHKARTEHEIKRDKDVENLKSLFSNFNMEIFENYLENMPSKLDAYIFPFWYGVSACFNSGKFYLYDRQTNTKIKAFISLWGKTLNHSSIFRNVPRSRYYFLNTQGDVFIKQRDEDEMYVCTKEILLLRKKYDALLTYLREKYYDIDFDVLSDTAFEHNKEYLKK